MKCRYTNKAIKVIVSLFFALCFSSISASANAGTPLVQFGLFHLVIGNTLIGLLEGYLIYRFFKAENGKCVIIMILANYFSCIVGYILTLIAGQGLLDSIYSEISIYNVGTHIISSIILLIILTIILEWPFCFYILRRKEKPVITSLRASIFVQLISYLFLFLIYFHMSDISLITTIKRESPKLFAQNKSYSVYFISKDRHNISRIDINGLNRKRIATYPNKYFSMLYVKRSKDNRYWDLRGYYVDKSSFVDQLIIKNVSAKGNYIDPDGRLKDSKNWFVIFGNAICLYTCDITVKTGFWWHEGLNTSSSNGDEGIHIALETPFVRWFSRDATLLPDELIVYEINDQILLFDNKNRKLGLLVRGLSPVVVDESK